MGKVLLLLDRPSYIQNFVKFCLFILKILSENHLRRHNSMTRVTEVRDESSIAPIIHTVEWFDILVGELVLNVPVNDFSVMLGRSHRSLGITSTFGE